MVKESIYAKLILNDGNVHPSQDKVIAIFLYDFNAKKYHYFNFHHPDVLVNSSFEDVIKIFKNKKVYVNNKKRNKYFLDGQDLYDVNLLSFLKNGNIFDFPRHIFNRQLQISHSKINQTNIIIPYSIHQYEFEKEVELISEFIEEDTETYCYKFFNNISTDVLFMVEKNGLYVDPDLFLKHFDTKVKNNMVYSEYNIYNPTGRPSNKFDGINYVALNKEDGCRSSFISRYKNGKLLMVDFTGFHPYIVSQLIKYDVPENETIYEHLAKQYYSTNNINQELINKAKKLTMVNLYGQISEHYIHIPFFEKTELLKNKYWEEFTNKGYVKTPIYKRKITKNHISDPNKNKLFAYIIQAVETEFGLNSLNNCIKYVSGKPIVPILYIYDSILFDIDETVTQSQINDLVDIIKNKKFKVRVYIGNNYNDLKLV